ncbi:MGH1-like glycoside hydrolase domain-containing protein [Sphingobacterium siyangense]|uniref:MGH1-like glycoside hydrolase domain-containing protein n=1 Tax=Sphingobacterium siyangense TaxID=459529 RepID=UPI003DA206C2
MKRQHRSVFLKSIVLSCTAFLFLCVLFSCSINRGLESNQELIYLHELNRLKEAAKNNLVDNIEEFNSYKERPKSDGPFNESNNQEFLVNNIPYFESSNDTLSRVYNYRWWMISKHLRDYYDPHDLKNYWVITEFFGYPAWGSLSGAITCPTAHQFYDVRWLRDPKYLQSYAEYFMLGSASKLNQRENGNFLTHLSRPESVHFSSWMVDGIESFLKIHPDKTWTQKMLPAMETHQHLLDSLFTVKNAKAKTDGMYKVLDLYDGMEFSLSAVLGLIESNGPYDIYTDSTWRDLYLGWETTDEAAKTKAAKNFPLAFTKGYPDFYLVRPSVGSYSFGNTNALYNLYRLEEQQNPTSENKRKEAHYKARAQEIQQKFLRTLWNSEDGFFNTFTAGDNAYGVRDYEARVGESVGYTPWYFNMIPAEDNKKYEVAWAMFTSENGFNNHKGMTTAERQHPYYNEQAYAWNGRGWPFQNSVVYKAYSNYLRNYKNQITAQDKETLYEQIMKLTRLHDYAHPNIGEWYIPSEGGQFGGQQDYFHSTYPDMIIADLIGFKGMHSNGFQIQPLIPAGKMDYFYLGNLTYHGKTIDIVWKEDWDENKFGKQPMLCIWVDHVLKATSKELDVKIDVNLD